MSNEITRYFTVKCPCMDALQAAHQSKAWRCPSSIFLTPHHHGNTQDGHITVTLVFTVTDSRGWYGYAVVEPPPAGTQHAETSAQCPNLELSDHGADSDVIPTDSPPGGVNFLDVQIKWIKSFISEHGEKCLPFSRTKSLKMEDGRSVNKCLDFMELPQEVGVEICERIDEYFGRLDKKKQEHAVKQLEVFTPSCNTTEQGDTQLIWQEMIDRVGAMGRVLLACSCGSQRYNLHTADSDMDMFIVYAADTVEMLGFHPPQTTIKNRREEAQDYTIHEVHRFCELVVQGDPQCVETLFMDPASCVYIDEHFKLLCQHRKKLLTRKCLDGYLRHATGNKGLKLLEKLHKAEGAIQSTTSRKIGKLFCLIIRLLQNARDVARGDDLHVYRPDTSPEREILMTAKRNECSYHNLDDHVKELLNEIGALRLSRWPEDEDGTKADDDDDNEMAEKCVTDWLMKLRYENLKQHMKTELHPGATDRR